tara:strand:+ start:403 stop:1050 length:648 start_codon:yes stop_codon:yes gene_type:complete
MPLPLRYPDAVETNQLNFSFADALSGTGTATYYGTGTQDNKILTTVVSDASNPKTIAVSSGGGEDIFEANFDLLFDNTTAIVDGRLITTFTLDNDGNSNGTVISKAKVTAYHVDSASTETTIGAQITTDTFTITNAIDKSRRYTVDWDITRKKFKIGEKLRIEIIYNVNDSAGEGGSTCVLYHEPSDRTASAVDAVDSAITANATTLLTFVPFRI